MDCEDEERDRPRFEYEANDHVQFVKDMEEAGLKVRHYRGRWYWEGPAVVVEDLQDALGATKVRCQWDEFGRRASIVYPKAYGEARPIEEDDDGEELT
jgi:hypothetical protein